MENKFFQRPGYVGPPFSAGTKNYSYAERSFTTTLQGEHLIKTTGGAISDPTLYLYEDIFNSTKPLENLIAANDDGGPGLMAKIVHPLDANREYVIVVSTFNTDETSGTVNFTLKYPTGGGIALGPDRQEEAERQRLADEEAERQRLADEEAERQRLADEEDERQRLADEEADRVRQQRLGFVRNIKSESLKNSILHNPERLAYFSTLTEGQQSEAEKQINEKNHDEIKYTSFINPIHNIIYTMTDESIISENSLLTYSSNKNFHATAKNIQDMHNFQALYMKQFQSFPQSLKSGRCRSPIPSYGYKKMGTDVPIKISPNSAILNNHKVWLMPFHTLSKQASYGDTTGANQNTSGILMGIDRKIADYTLGIMGGHSNTQYHIHNMYGRGKIRTGYGGLYASYNKGLGFHVNVSSIILQNRYHSERGIPIFHHTMQYKRKSYAVSHNIKFNYTVPSPYAFFTPFLSLGFSQENRAHYKEYGPSPFNLSLPKQSSSSFISESGLAIKKILTHPTTSKIQGFITVSMLH